MRMPKLRTILLRLLILIFSYTVVIVVNSILYLLPPRPPPPRDPPPKPPPLCEPPPKLPLDRPPPKLLPLELLEGRVVGCLCTVVLLLGVAAGFVVTDCRGATLLPLEGIVIPVDGRVCVGAELLLPR